MFTGQDNPHRSSLKLLSHEILDFMKLTAVSITPDFMYVENMKGVFRLFRNMYMSRYLFPKHIKPRNLKAYFIKFTKYRCL